MIIYNITTKVAWPISEAWQKWMLDEHIPEILGTGCFVKHQFAKLLEVDEEDGPTFTLQFYAASLVKYQQYVNQYSQTLRQKSLETWGNQTIAFRTLMEVLQ